MEFLGPRVHIISYFSVERSFGHGGVYLLLPNHACGQSFALRFFAVSLYVVPKAAQLN